MSITASISTALRRQSRSEETAVTHRYELDVSDEAVLPLVQRLYLSMPQAQVQLTGFAGVDHGVGTTHVTARVARSLSGLLNGRICAVDANVRSPRLAEEFGLTNVTGFGDFITSDRPVMEFVRQVRSSNLFVMTAGASLSKPTLALRPMPALYSRLLDLRSKFEYVLIDLPPINRYRDAVIIGPATDGVSIVLRANQSRRVAVAAAVATLKNSETRVFGAVLNQREYPLPEAIYRRF